MRVVGSSAARVWRMTQKASECPHFGHSTRVFGSVSVISSRTSVSAGFSFPGRATRVTVASFPERERSYPHELQCTFPFAGKRSEPHFGQNMRDGHAKDACDKKVARSELRVVVVLQCALDESLDRALLGLGTGARRTRGRLLRFGLFVIVRLPVVRGVAGRWGWSGGAGAGGWGGWVALLVLFVALFSVGAARAPPEARRRGVAARRGAGPGAGGERGGGLFRDHPADVREDDHHEVSV